MSEHTSDYYENLYKRHKKLIDKVDNPCIKVKHYSDKKHHHKAIVDIEDAIYIDPITQQIRFKGV